MMYTPRPIINRLTSPAEILDLELIKEFIGLDDDLDANQDKLLPVLRSAVIEDGEQITGTVWGAASYRIDGLWSVWPGAGIQLPLAPVFRVEEVRTIDRSSVEMIVDPDNYKLIPSAIDFGRPWAELRPADLWPEEALTFSITCTAGWAVDTLPESIRSWALVRIATLYDNRMDAVTGTITSNMPRDHARGLLDRWTVRGNPYAFS